MDPLLVTEVESWHAITDVLVVGYGIAGACAAIEAANAGVDTLILERASGGGGTSITSSGIFYLGGGTALQRDLHIQDSSDDMYRYLSASGGVSDPELIQAVSAGSVEHFDWLELQGIPFNRTYYKDKHFCPPTAEGLLGTGNEKLWPFCDLAKAVARGHRAAKEGDNAGLLVMERLMQRCQEGGVKVRFDTRVDALITDEQQSIVGVRAMVDGREVCIGARRGVVLATGGFQHNEELLRRHADWVLGDHTALGVPYNDGAGILLGQSVDATVHSMGEVMVTASFYPSSQLIKGIMVNQLGQRFVAEDSYHGRSAAFVREQLGGIAYLIVDAEIFSYPELAKVFGIELVDGWETIEDMERGLSIAAGALSKTIEHYNRDASAGDDLLLHKSREWLKPLNNPPYAAFDISFDRVRHNFQTIGGLKTTAKAEVISLAGKPIAGLFAAGCCSHSLTQDAKGYASGMTLTSGSFFGRAAGRNAAARPAARCLSGHDNIERKNR